MNAKVVKEALAERPKPWRWRWYDGGGVMGYDLYADNGRNILFQPAVEHDPLTEALLDHIIGLVNGVAS